MRFDIHWSEVHDAHSPSGDDILLAVWPAPVNPDECFAAAGFTDFADADQAWDAEATALLARVVEALTQHGAPELVSAPLMHEVPLHRRLFESPAPLPLLEQLEQPMHWDSLPPCMVRFGTSGASLRTGEGHILMWVTLPHGARSGMTDFLAGLAAGRPLLHTTLDWRHLRAGAHATPPQGDA